MDIDDYRKWWDGHSLSWRAWHTINWRLSYLYSAIFGTISYAERSLLRVISQSNRVNVGASRIKLTEDEIQILATEYVDGSDYQYFLDNAIDDAEIDDEIICDIETKYKYKCNLLVKLTGDGKYNAWPAKIKEELLKRKAMARNNANRDIG